MGPTQVYLVFGDLHILGTEMGTKKLVLFISYAASEILAHPNVINTFFNVCSIIDHTISPSAYCALSSGHHQSDKMKTLPVIFNIMVKSYIFLDG